MTTKLNTDAHARLRAALMEDPAFRAEYERLIEENREPWHGTVGGYTNRHCRCDACRQASTAYHVAHRKGVCSICGGVTSNRYVSKVCRACYMKNLHRAEHGSERCYVNGCRCDECRQAATSARSERRRRAKGPGLFTPTEIEKFRSENSKKIVTTKGKRG